MIANYGKKIKMKSENQIRAFSVLGNIAIVNFPDGLKSGHHRRTPKDFQEKSLLGAKKKFAQEILKNNKAVRTVLEKSGKFKGRLRKMETRFVAGEKTKEVIYRENNCVFRFNVDTTYFSPRLSNERKEIADAVKPNEEVLVMFAGVAPFSIVIARNSMAKKVYSNEINREANKYAKLNIELNKVKERVELIGGDIKRVVKRLSSHPPPHPSAPSAQGKINARDFNLIPSKFDVIVMPRPQLKDSFLHEAFMLSKKGTRIYYYDFCAVDDIDKIVEKVKREAGLARRNIKILKVKKAGEIAPYKVRVRVDFKVLS